MQHSRLGLKLRVLTYDLRCLVCPQSIRYSDIVCELTQLVACLQTIGYRVGSRKLACCIHPRTCVSVKQLRPCHQVVRIELRI